MPGKAPAPSQYRTLLRQIAGTIETGRSRVAWSLNAIMSAVYWDIGRQIVEFEQKGTAKAEYGERVIALLALDLERRFGRGFRKSHLYQFRRFYLIYRDTFQTVSGKSLPDRSSLSAFTLPWSHYVRLLSVKTEGARKFYETEALRGGWSFRQL
jgi:hypothetical protein